MRRSSKRRGCAEARPHKWNAWQPWPWPTEFGDLSAPRPRWPACAASLGSEPLLVIPGIRPEGAAIGDQRRVATPAAAMAAGASYLVVGRPITRAADPGVRREPYLAQMQAAGIASALKLLVKITGRAGDVNASGNSALPILYSFHNASCLVAFGTLNALGSVHHLRTVGGFGYFCHGLSLLLQARAHFRLNLFRTRSRDHLGRHRRRC